MVTLKLKIDDYIITTSKTRQLVVIGANNFLHIVLYKIRKIHIFA